MNLYHYTKMSTAIDCILKYKTIRFSKISGTNDPYEKMPCVFSIDGNVDGLNIGEGFRRAAELAARLKDNIKLFCAATDAPTSKKNELGELLFNFDKGFSKPRMWAQYSENGTGICFILDSDSFLEKAKLTFSDCEIQVKRINYCSQGEFVYRVSNATSLTRYELSMNDDNLLEYMYKKHSDIYFFTKHPDWKDENEIRYLLRERNDVERDVDVDGIIKAVILGINADDDRIEEIKKLISEFDNPPDLYHLEFWDGYYQIIPIEESDDKT